MMDVSEHFSNSELSFVFEYVDMSRDTDTNREKYKFEGFSVLCFFHIKDTCHFVKL